MSTVADRLANGELVLIDGATGTDIERREVPMTEGAWCGAATLTHPDDVCAVHVDHINAGAELIIANSYASSRHVLAQAGLEDRFEDANRMAVEQALQARTQTGRTDVLIAGSMSTTHQGGEFPDVATARKNYADQARVLADAGADLIVLEMMRDIEQTEACLAGAVATGLPVWMGISAEVDEDGVVQMWERRMPMADVVKRFANEPIEVMTIMHTETHEIDACLDVLQQHWDGPVGVYAQSGIFEPPVWRFIDVISAEEYAEACMRWVDRGVQVIGGCCGIGHEHIAHLKPLLDAKR